MANKRKLKKTINSVCDELLAECMIATQFGDKPIEDDMHAVFKSIVAINEEHIKRVSHPEPGMRPKDYYKDVIGNFQKAVVEIIDQLSYLN